MSETEPLPTVEQAAAWVWDAIAYDWKQGVLEARSFVPRFQRTLALYGDVRVLEKRRVWRGTDVEGERIDDLERHIRAEMRELGLEVPA